MENLNIDKVKVLSLKEPWATLIAKKIKIVETRSWKTSYRGTIYIHASSSKIIKHKIDNKLLELIGDTPLNYGHIICKCTLVDCIEMTREYVNEMKSDNPREYTCGVYEEGRYAWILESIELLEQPIEAKGHLGLWNYEIETK